MSESKLQHVDQQEEMIRKVFGKDSKVLGHWQLREATFAKALRMEMEARAANVERDKGYLKFEDFFPSSAKGLPLSGSSAYVDNPLFAYDLIEEQKVGDDDDNESHLKRVSSRNWMHSVLHKKSHGESSIGSSTRSLYMNSDTEPSPRSLSRRIMSNLGISSRD